MTRNARINAVGLFALCALVLGLAADALAADAKPARSAAEAPALSAAEGPAPQFAAKPKIEKQGDKYVITFACHGPCDAAVAIVGKDGRIVRHLAGGVLGKNAPAPFVKDALAQRLEWDGKDDDGKPAAAADNGPFTVRVGLGLKPVDDGLAFADKDHTGANQIENVAGLAVGPDGRLFMMDKWSGLAWWSTQKIHVFRRDGSYEKTIKPFPSSIALDKVKAIGAFVNSFGSVNPLIYRPEGTSFYPQEEVAQQPAVTADGRIVMATRSNISEYNPARYHLAVIDTDGGVPEGGYDGPTLKTAWGPAPCLAPSADGKTIYLTGVQASGQRQKATANAVYTVKLPDRGPLEVFFGEPDAAAADNAHLSNPRSVALDGKGHVLVADFGNNRVVVLNEKDKSFAGSFAVETPSWVAVHPQTGAVYVCSKQSQVIKFAPPAASDFKEAKELARADLSGLLKSVPDRYRAGTAIYCALDCSAEPAVLWAGCSAQLVRCEDQGTKFTEPAPADCKPSQFYFRPAADPTRREVVCRIGIGNSRLHVMDEASGQTRIVGDGDLAGKEGRTHRLGPDGTIYAQDHAQGLARFDRDGKPKPFEATVNDGYLKGRLPVGSTGTTMWERDFYVDRRNEIYVRARGTAYHGQMDMQQYDQQGNFKRTVLYAVSDGMFGPRVDAQGNIYIMEIVTPVGQPYPEEFKGRTTAKTINGYPTMHWYEWIYGSIVKFGPAGGAVWFGPGWLSQSSPLNYEGWRAATHDGPTSITDLKTTGGSLTGQIARKPATVIFPSPSTLDTKAVNKVSFRLKNDSDGTAATLAWHIVGERYATPASTKTVEIKPNSGFAEYTFDLAGEKDWKTTVFNLSLVPTNGAKGSFAIDWVKVGLEGQPGAKAWNFNAEDSKETKLPATMKKEKVGSYMCPQGAEVQGAIWMQPGFGHVGQCSNNDHCHCAGTDFDMDDYARIFAPDTGRFRVGVLDSNGNPIVSFGRYGNQDSTGPDIAFGWIVGVAVTDRYAYVDDLFNKRVVRVRLDYAATETCPVP